MKNGEKYFKDDKINRQNLVARYKSLPKKCFYFLHVGSRFEHGGAPLERILEASESNRK
jgi:hypothetical protein